MDRILRLSGEMAIAYTALYRFMSLVDDISATVP
jgi:hypothetical protein